MKLDEVKQKLEEKLRRLESELEKVRDEDPYEDKDRVNDNAASDTEAAEEEGHLRSEVLEDELEIGIDQVEKAIERCDKGTWGVCQDCGEKIDPKRLELDLSYEFCVKCAAKNEA